MIATIVDPCRAVKYAAAMASSTSKAWGVYRGNRRFFLVRPTGYSKEKPFEVCHP